MRTLICVLGMICICTSCRWQEAKEVIAVADSLDQTEHVIYDDTAALGGVIRQLDNPIGRMLMSNTLGKAYYYMGRNLSFSDQIAEAAKCYVAADRLQIHDPIYRGRVNSCMGYICAQNNKDSLALIFYERASKHFKESGNEWYYAQLLLDRAEFQTKLQNYAIADSLLQIAKSRLLDSLYKARYYETLGLYFYEQLQFDSALVYFERGLDYWQNEENKCFSYLKIMQINIDIQNIAQAVSYALFIIDHSNNPNYLVNAYYCLMQNAKNKNNVELLSKYSHARTDAQKSLRNAMLEDAKALPILAEYLNNPHPLRWIRITLLLSLILCTVLAVSIAVYRKSTTAKIQQSNIQIDNLSLQIKEQKEELNKHLEMHLYDKRLDKLRRKYPKPLNNWNEYRKLKKDIDPYLHNWLIALEKLDLTNRENVCCVLSFIYPQLPVDELASYMCITKDAVAVRKARIAKKIDITSPQLPEFLQSL